MMLVIGGRASGKEEWVMERFRLTPVPCTPQQALSAPAIKDFQETVRSLIDESADIEAYVVRLAAANPNAIILCDEVGMGVIPLERADRLWREAVGRACCLVQQRAHTVVRVVCGIPIHLKGAP